MRPWTIPAAVGCLLISGAGSALGQPPVRPGGAPSSAAAGPLPVRLVVGERFDAAIRGTSSVHVVRRSTGERFEGNARFTSSDPGVLSVRGTTLIALSEGTATVTPVPAGMEGVSVVALPVRVVSAQQEVNEMVIEVCPNRDSSNFVMQAPLDTGVLAIHEFHDCQRLIADGRYGPVVGVFAHGNLQDVESWQNFTAERLVAIVVNFAGTTGAAEYPSLGIGPGINCLFLRATSKAAWTARMVRQSQAFVAADGTRHYGRCDQFLGPAQRGTPLEVKLQEGVDMSGAPKAPPVARWDWDPRHARNYIGVKCGTATWCEIGPRGFVTSPPRIFPQQFQVPWWRWFLPRPRRAQIIKGYYDEQFLADSLTKRPTTVFGTVMPGLDARTAGNQAPPLNARLHVAQITLRETGPQSSADYQRYSRAFVGTAAPPFPQVQSPLHLRYVNVNQTDRKYDGSFNGRALRAGDVAYRQHHSHAANMQMPTARWRWVERDELVWTYCKPDGCCEVTATLQ